MNGANEIDAFINSKQAMRVTLMIYLSCITYVYSLKIRQSKFAAASLRVSSVTFIKLYK